MLFSKALLPKPLRKAWSPHMWTLWGPTAELRSWQTRLKKHHVRIRMGRPVPAAAHQWGWVGVDQSPHYHRHSDAVGGSRAPFFLVTRIPGYFNFLWASGKILAQSSLIHRKTGYGFLKSFFCCLLLFLVETRFSFQHLCEARFTCRSKSAAAQKFASVFGCCTSDGVPSPPPPPSLLWWTAAAVSTPSLMIGLLIDPTLEQKPWKLKVCLHVEFQSEN